VNWTRNKNIAALGLLAVLSAAAPAARAQTASPDFSLAPAVANQVLSLGYLVRGGLQSCTGNCLGALVEPKLQACVDDFTCTTYVYTTSNLEVISKNGFLGTVTLELLDLPAGVVSQVAPSVTIASGSGFPPFASTPFTLKAGAAAPLGTFTVTVRATSGLLVHTIGYTVTIVDALPPLPPGGQLGGLSAISVNPQFTLGGTANVVAGTSTSGTVFLTGGGPGPGGLTIALGSSSPSLATVSPVSLTIPEGGTSAKFTVSTAPVSAPVQVSISASDGATTTATLLTIWPPDGVSVTRAQYDTSKKQLGVEATDTATGVTLNAYVTATGEAIGTLQDAGGGKFKGQLFWAVNPQKITVRSNQGGAGTAAVAGK
jgi:hypothetical protein